jgi:RNA polymerase sigma factor (sigma-70 family)
VCLRYSRNREEAVEIVIDGFMKIFKNLNKYTDGRSFKSWLRKIMVNASIDYFRRNEKHYHNLDISYAQYQTFTETAIETLSAQEIIDLVQKLPPSYRMVFNLYVIEGFKHEEIANQLNIGIGTSYQFAQK